jgi:hypothetical protein
MEILTSSGEIRIPEPPLRSVSVEDSLDRLYDVVGD